MNNVRKHRFTTSLLLISLAVLLLASGCSRRKGADGKAGSSGGDGEALTEAEQLKVELEQKIKEDFSEESLAKKAVESYATTIASPDYIANNGDIRAVLNLPQGADVSSVLAKAPTAQLNTIISELTRRLKADIYAQYNLVNDDDIPRTIRNRYPMVKVRDRITLPNIKGRHVSGMVASITRTDIRIGSARIIRDDLPMEYRAQIWEEERQPFIEQKIRDEQSRNRWHQDKYLKPALAKELPAAFLKAGYLPNPLDSEATLTSIEPKHWLPANQVIPKLVAYFKNNQEAYVEAFWKKHGYVKRSTADGTVWIPDPKKK